MRTPSSPTIVAIDAAAGSPTADRLKALIERFREAPTDYEVAHLARRLAESGAMLPERHDALDIASTGAPSSLSTLLCPLQLNAIGLRVPKLAIPGRPAGGIDVLAMIPHYEVNLDLPRIEEILASSGYVHFLADQRWAPLDARLFHFRQEAGAQELAALVIASLLAKKLAVGLRRTGLEVRVAPHGNFGADVAVARENAATFVRVARLVGVRAVCILTDATAPYQPFIGRGESLLALDLLLRGHAPAALERHAEQCRRMTAGAASVPPLSIPPPTKLREHFRANLEAQGSGLDLFAARIDELRRQPRRQVVARAPGYPRWALHRLRMAIVEAQQRIPRGTGFTDPCGVTLTNNGEAVEEGSVIAEVRGETEESALALADVLSESYSIEDGPTPPSPLILESVDG